jgi:hypothetical protein
MSWRGIPVAALILAAVALLMLGPAALGAATQDWRSAQVF